MGAFRNSRRWWEKKPSGNCSGSTLFTDYNRLGQPMPAKLLGRLIQIVKDGGQVDPLLPILRADDFRHFVLATDHPPNGRMGGSLLGEGEERLGHRSRVPSDQWVGHWEGCPSSIAQQDEHVVVWLAAFFSGQCALWNNVGNHLFAKHGMAGRHLSNQHVTLHLQCR